MGWRIWQKINKEEGSSNLELQNYPIFLVRPFYVLSITLLSLLLPLSFLLLARLSSAHYLLSLASSPPQSSLLYSLFLYTNPNLLHALVSIVSISTLIHSLTGRVGPLSEFSGPVFRPRLHVSWIFLCTLQVCVGLGIEATIKAGVDGAGFGEGRSMVSKLVFFLGLHDTMAHWARSIVRPVVDDTLFGGARRERWPERWALGVGFAGLAWWRLRDEVESLVVVVEVKKAMMMKVGLGDFLGWWLYYLTVAIGMARIIKGIMWFFIVSFCKRRVEDDEDHDIELIREEEDKV